MLTRRVIVASMTTASTAPIDETTPPATALHRAIAIQLDATTDAVRAAWDRVLARVRTALDLPTRGELAALSARLDALDARLAALAEAEADDDGKDRRKKRS